MNVNKNELVEAIQEALVTAYNGSKYTTEPIETWREYGEQFGYALNSELYGSNVLATSVGVVSHAESFGGEGQGDSMWVVIKLTEEDGTETFWKLDGYYSSWDASEWEEPSELYQVESRPVTEMQYFAI